MTCCKECGQRLPETREPLTPRQMEALEHIRDCIRVAGVAPSLRALGVMMGLRSLASVHELVRAVEAKGHIRVLRKRRHGIRLVGE